MLVGSQSTRLLLSPTDSLSVSPTARSTSFERNVRGKNTQDTLRFLSHGRDGQWLPLPLEAQGGDAAGGAPLRVKRAPGPMNRNAGEKQGQHRRKLPPLRYKPPPPPFLT